MIRLVQRKLIIPRGDTGTFSVPILSTERAGDTAVFTIFDKMTQRRIYSKQITSENGVFNIRFNHSDTVNLPAGKYYWDIKYYQNPVFVDEELVDGQEIDSYYAAFSVPECEIRETGDVMLAADDAPNALLAPDQLNILNGALGSIQDYTERAQAAAQQASQKVQELRQYNYTLEEQDYNEIARRVVVPQVDLSNIEADITSLKLSKVPNGGAAGTVLTKRSSSNGDYDWVALPSNSSTPTPTPSSSSDLDNVIGNVNEGTTANRYYYQYEFIVMDNKVYRITQDIEEGEEIIPNTNCRETSILQQLGNFYTWLFGE